MINQAHRVITRRWISLSASTTDSPNPPFVPIGIAYIDDQRDGLHDIPIQALGQLRYLGQPRGYGIRIGRRFGY